MNFCNLEPVEPYGSNCYLLSSSGEFAVIDPSADYSETVEAHPEIEGRLKYVLLTHAHFDHFLAIDSWSERCEAVIVGAEDAASLSDSAKNCYLGFLGVDDGYNGAYRSVTEGDVLHLGNEEITVIACPGHTPGGVSYKIGDDVFCGDTAFCGNIGRTDLPTGSFVEIITSITDRLMTLPDHTIVYPGHGKITMIQDEKNIYLERNRK